MEKRKPGPTKERIHYIDLTESLAMLFVMAYHLSNLYYSPLRQFTAETALNYYVRCVFVSCVPLFLVTNGYLLFHHEFNLKRHLKKTLQYLVLTLFWAVMTQLASNWSNGNSQGLREFIDAILTWRYDVIHLWYMGALVIIYLLFPLLKSVYDRDEKLLRYFIIMISVVTFGNETLNHGMTILNDLRGVSQSWVVAKNWFSMFNPVAEVPGFTLVYFCLGAYLQDFLDWLKKFSRRRINLLAILCLLVLMFIHAVMFIRFSRLTGRVQCPIWCGYETVTGFLISLCMVILLGNYQGKREKGAKLLALVSSNSLGIYFMHMVVVHFLRPRVYLVPVLNNLPMNLILSVVVIGVCLVVTLLLRRIPILKKLVS